MLSENITYGQLHERLTHALEEDPGLKKQKVKASFDNGIPSEVHVWNGLLRRDETSEELEESGIILHVPTKEEKPASKRKSDTTKVLELLEAKTPEAKLSAMLATLNITSSVEHPGYVHVDLPTAAVMAIGYTDGFWGYDITRKGVNVPIEKHEIVEMWKWFKDKKPETVDTPNLAMTVYETIHIFKQTYVK